MCYRSTNYSVVGSDNNDNLYQLLREVSKEQFLLMGDFNYPDVNWFYHNTDVDASSDSIEFLDCVNDCFLSQHVLQPTRFNSILDLVFTRDPDLVSSTKVIEHLGNSDHNMICFSIHHEKDIPENSRLLRDYCKGDYQSMRNELANIDWDLFMADDMLKCWSKFRDLLLDLEQRFIPTRNKSNASFEAVQYRQDMRHIAHYYNRKKSCLPMHAAQKITVIRAQKIGKFAVSNLILCTGAIWRRTEKFEHRCTTTYHPL